MRTCFPAEVDGPLDAAVEAAALVRSAGAAVAQAAIGTGELGVGRVGRSLALAAEELFVSADCMEPEGG